MMMTMGRAVLPMFRHSLTALSGVLRMAEKEVAARGIEDAALLQARLAPDMFPLVQQVQIATDFAKGACARLTAIKPPVFSDDETSFADLQHRIDATLAFLAGITPEQIDASPIEVVEIRVRGEATRLNVAPYLVHFAIPNFFFHLTTAYAILRSNGVPLGKSDFIGGVPDAV